MLAAIEVEKEFMKELKIHSRLEIEPRPSIYLCSPTSNNPVPGI